MEWHRKGIEGEREEKKGRAEVRRGEGKVGR